MTISSFILTLELGLNEPLRSPNYVISVKIESVSKIP